MNNQEEDEKNELVKKLSMADGAYNNMIALPLVMLFEVLMTISWVVNVKDKTAPSSLAYLVGYISLFTFSAITLVLFYKWKQDIDRNYRKIYHAQAIESFIYVLWAVSFTYVGSEMRGNFDYLIFVSMMTLLPLFVYVKQVYWTFLQVTGTACVFWMASHHDRFFAFCINFMVFSIVSLVASWLMHHIRCSYYIRQIELEKEKEKVHRIAYQDALTGLPNRHSYNERFYSLNDYPNKEHIILMVCDINGLKKVNDEMGHKAGDELIRGAGECLQKAFSGIGTIYRMGGDEFAGIMECSEEQIEEAIRNLENITSNWKGTNVQQVSVSIGYASVRNNPSLSLDALFTNADNAMYEAKRRHYEGKAIDN